MHHARPHFVRPSTGAARSADKTDRWMNLHCGMVSFRRTLHLVWNRLQAFSMTLLRVQILSQTLQYDAISRRVRRALGHYLNAIARAMPMQVYARQIRRIFWTDHNLFDIRASCSCSGVVTESERCTVTIIVVVAPGSCTGQRRVVASAAATNTYRKATVVAVDRGM